MNIRNAMFASKDSRLRQSCKITSKRHMKPTNVRFVERMFSSKKNAIMTICMKSTKKQLKGLEKGKVTKTRTKTKTTGYNVFVKEKFAEIAQEQPELSNADVMKLVGGRWKNMSKVDQKPYCDLADQRNAPVNVESTETPKVSCVWCDKMFDTKEMAKTHMKIHLSSSTGNQLNRFAPDDLQDHIKKCNVCGLMLNERNIAEHMKIHEPENLLVEVSIIDDEASEQIEETLEEATVHEVVPVVVLVKLRTKYWPAEVIQSSSDSYEVKLCKRGEVLTVKKNGVKAFIPGLDICKGQSRDWKECYQVALEILET
jgi:hypothetical protein